MELVVEQKIREKYEKYQKKYWRSKLTYLLVNVMIMVVTVTLSMVSAKAIQANKENPNKWLFLAIMILNILITFVSAINSLFLFENLITQYKNEIETIMTIQQDRSGKYDNFAVIKQLTNTKKWE